MPLISLLRHGEPEQPGLLLGRTDPVLSDRGWRQFRQQTAAGAWSRIVSSPLRRSREPAEALAKEHGLPYQLDSDWSELDFGRWDGRSPAELRADHATAAQLDRFYADESAPAPPEGENWQALNIRVGRAFGSLLATGVDDTVLVVTHAGPMRMALSLACGIPFEQTWAFRIEYGTRITLRVGSEDEWGIWGEIIEIMQP